MGNGRVSVSPLESGGSLDGPDGKVIAGVKAS